MEKLEKGSIQTGEVVSYGSDGEGILKINGFPIFVPEAVVGDNVKVEILKSKKTFANGKIVEIVEKSENRVDEKDICPYFKKCGGCTISNMDYESQLKFKKEKVEQTLKRIGGVSNFQIFDTMGMDIPFYYRNKAQFPIEKVGNKIVIGFYQKRSHNIIEIKECSICDEKINTTREVVESFLNSKDYTVYDEQTKKGLLRKLVVKISATTGEIMIILVVNGNELPYFEEFIECVKTIDGVSSIVLNKNTKNDTGNMGLNNKVLYGTDFITDHIEDTKFKISPLSFYQVNHKQTVKLYSKVIEFLNLQGHETVVDCYCGIGTISLLLAKKAKKVIGIEVVDDAINNAIENSQINNIGNVEFYAGKVETVINKILKKNKVDAIVVDPPRKGLEDVVVEEIIQSGINKLVYVSCDCSTLARDLKMLAKEGYIVEKVQPVDMFAQSSHIESVVLITKS